MKVFRLINFIFFIFWVLAISSLSCNDNAITYTDTSKTFSFSIDVRDVDGNPKNGINVKLIPLLSGEINVPLLRSNTKQLNDVTSTTVILFDFSRDCRSSLSITDLNHKIIGELLDTNVHAAGIYSVQWDAPDLPSSVYKIILKTRTPLGDTSLFCDSIYAILRRPQEFMLPNGWLSEGGFWETIRKEFFPSLYPLQPINGRTVSNDETEEITFRDSIGIVLTDTSSSASQTLVLPVKDGKNRFTITWNPLSRNKLFPFEMLPSKFKIEPRDTIGPVTLPLSFKLYQNYPNPFY
jgi:hypothetical protein